MTSYKRMFFSLLYRLVCWFLAACCFLPNPIRRQGAWNQNLYWLVCNFEAKSLKIYSLGRCSVVLFEWRFSWSHSIKCKFLLLKRSVCIVHITHSTYVSNLVVPVFFNWNIDVTSTEYTHTFTHSLIHILAFSCWRVYSGGMNVCNSRILLHFFEYWDVQPLNSVVFSDEWQPIIRFKLFTPFVLLLFFTCERARKCSK